MIVCGRSLGWSVATVKWEGIRPEQLLTNMKFDSRPVAGKRNTHLKSSGYVMGDTARVGRRPILCSNLDSLGPFRDRILASVNLSWRHREVTVRIRKERV